MASVILVSSFVVLLLIVAMLIYNQWLARYDARVLKKEREAQRTRVVDLYLSNTGEECVYSECSKDLVCDANDWTCKKKSGAECSFTTECVDGTFCSGTCSAEDYNKLKKRCPCKFPLLCTENTVDGTYRCLKSDKQTCSSGGECSGGVCYMGSCYSKKGIAKACIRDSDCSTSNCSRNVCQPDGVVSHARGASCNLGVTNDVAYCNGGLTCYPTADKGSVGVCMDAPLALGDPCTVDGSMCSGDLACISESTFSPCTDPASKIKSTTCTCRLPFPDPRVGNAARECAGTTTWSTVSGRCLSVVGGPCRYNSDCSTGGCIGNPVIVRYEMKTTEGGSVSLETSVENYAPKNVEAIKFRTYRVESSASSPSSILVNLLLGKDGSIYYSVPYRSEGSKEKLVSHTVKSIIDLESALTWKKLVSVASDHILDFDCDERGGLYAVADLSVLYGKDFTSCLVITTKPNIEAKISYHVSSDFSRVCVHATSKIVYMLNVASNSVSKLSPPNYTSATVVNLYLPNDTFIVDIFVSTIDGKETLMGLTDKGLLIGRLKDTGYDYPAGIFGNKWTAKIAYCDIVNCSKSGRGENLCVLAKCKVTASDAAQTVPVDALTYQFNGSTWLLPGPGGLSATSKEVSFQCSVDLDDEAVARVWFGKSCIPT